MAHAARPGGGAARRGAAGAARPGAGGGARRADGRALRGLIDVSGFAYGDVWGMARMERRRAYYAMLRARGVRLALVPQALGPFDDPTVRAGARALLGLFERVYARDARSFEILGALGLEGVRLGLAPDITHLLHPPPAPAPPAGARPWAERAVIVPNVRMLDRAGAAEAGAYRAFLLRAIARLREAGADPLVMLHEANDAALAGEIAREAGRGLAIIDPPALEAKAILGACRLVLSSRFHATIGALSQGTPTIGTSWSHKYQALFHDYGCPEMLLSPGAGDEALAARIAAGLGPASAGLRARLLAAAARERKGVEAMWRDVRATLAGAEGAA